MSVAFLHLICQLLYYCPAISPQWSPIILSLSPSATVGKHAYENHYENNASLCLRNVAYVFGALWFRFLCVILFVLHFVEASVERGELPGERWIKCFSFFFYYYWKAVKRSHRSRGQGNAFICLDTMFCLALFASISLRKTQKSNVPCENELYVCLHIIRLVIYCYVF